MDYIIRDKKLADRISDRKMKQIADRYVTQIKLPGEPDEKACTRCNEVKADTFEFFGKKNAGHKVLGKFVQFRTLSVCKVCMSKTVWESRRKNEEFK